MPEHRATIRPTYALVDDPTDPTSPARALVLVVPASARPSARPAGDQDWSATYTDRLAHALRAQNVPVGLVTNGTEWVIIGAPQSTATSTATFTRHVWREEPDTLRAFVNLLGLARFYGVPDDQTLPALLAESVTRQTEITEALSAQSQAVVEMLVASIGRLDSDHKAAHGHGLLPAGTEPSEVYEACVTILMRMVFLLYAEERGLLPADDDTYARAYAITTLTDRLTDRADQGEDALERSSEGWQRLLATAAGRGGEQTRQGGAAVDRHRHQPCSVLRISLRSKRKPRLQNSQVMVITPSSAMWSRSSVPKPASTPERRAREQRQP